MNWGEQEKEMDMPAREIMRRIKGVECIICAGKLARYIYEGAREAGRGKERRPRCGNLLF